MAQIELTSKERGVLTEIYDWLEAFVDYNLDFISDDGEETDAQRLSKMLPVFKRVLTKEASKPKVKTVTVEKTYTDVGDIVDLILHNPHIKDYFDANIRHARESVNPNYKYCLASTNLDDVWVCDDIGRVMEYGVVLAKTNGKSYNVCSIKEQSDGTYKLFIEGYCSRDGYMESGSSVRDYLHFDYVARCIGYDNIKKVI